MAQLGDHQKIDRVLPGKPFGDGRDGALVISSNTTQSLTAISCSGTLGSATLTLGSAGFSNGDIVLIHQSRGTGVGQWEINKIMAGGGSSSLTLRKPLTYTFTDSGASQAQCIKIPMYTSITVNASQTWSGANWDGDKNGFLLAAASVGLTVNGSISSTGKGYRGGAINQADEYGGQDCSGEGTAGAAVNQSAAANGNGGGGGDCEKNGEPARAGSGGGGHANAGSNGSSNSGGVVGIGGAAAGSADLTTFVFGGASGDVEKTFSGSHLYANGANGGGANVLFCKDITVNSGGSIVNAGNNGGSGGGAGGSNLLVCSTATLGTNLITAAAGIAPTGTGNDGGNGSVGRIAVHHIKAVTGTTNPTYSDQTYKPMPFGSGSALLALL